MPHLRPCILVTGGLGYIGSHTIVELLSAPFDVVAIDNLSNSSLDVLQHIHTTVEAVSAANHGQLHFVQADVTDGEALRSVFAHHFKRGRPITAVVHFAAVKSVAESLREPLRYYRENVSGLVTLLEVMHAWQCQRILFSSSATVYGTLSGRQQCVEQLIRHVADTAKVDNGLHGCVGLTNAYARTKWISEAILHDECVAGAGDFYAIALRYFNPVGAHPNGLLKETPVGAPCNLVPSVVHAIKTKQPIGIFGTDYDTEDGTAIRDYIHVVDLAKGHVAALHKLFSTSTTTMFKHTLLRSTSDDSMRSGGSSGSSNSDATSDDSTPQTPPTPSTDLFEEHTTAGLCVYNLGTGRGASVLEVISAMQSALGRPIDSIQRPRRDGDIMHSVADPRKANAELGWHAERTLQDACHDVCRALRS